MRTNMKTEGVTRSPENYGSLIDYLTGVYIRPATEQEWRASCEAEAGNVGGGSGVIKVNGESVFVSGGPVLAPVAAEPSPENL